MTRGRKGEKEKNARQGLLTTRKILLLNGGVKKKQIEQNKGEKGLPITKIKK